MKDQISQKTRQYWSPAAHGWWMWLEVLLITLCAVALGWHFHQTNPLWIVSEFPWTMLACVLIALRYGVIPGIASVLLLFVIWLLLARSTPSIFPKEYFFGGTILVMLCGQFNILWEQRLLRARETNFYIDERLSQLTHQHHLLLISHQNLEQEFFSKPMTLRDSLIRLNILLHEQQSLQGGEQELLRLLTQYCQLEAAAIFALQGKNFVKQCETGSPTPLDYDDPLLRHALKYKTLAHVVMQELQADNAQLSPYLVVAPMYLDNGALLGVLVVERMPLFALTTETLQMIAVMLEYFADSHNGGNDAYHLQELLIGVPNDFAIQLTKSLKMEQNFGIESHLVVFSLPRNDSSTLIIAQMNNVRRALDVGWTMMRKDKVLIVNLMPLANRKVVEGYLVRTEAWLHDYLGLHGTLPNLSPRIISLSEPTALEQLQAELGR